MAEIKYKFPTYIFLIFEKINPVVWNSSNDSNLDYFILIKDSELHNILNFFKKSISLNESYILDATGIDIAGFNFNNFSLNVKMLYIYTIYIVNTKIKIHIFFKQSDVLTVVKSSDFFYPNSNWLEREFCEMYGLQIFNKNDFRRLLLNYCENSAPMRREFISRGDHECYYNFSDRQVILNSSPNIEL